MVKKHSKRKIHKPGWWIAAVAGLGLILVMTTYFYQYIPNKQQWHETVQYNERVKLRYEQLGIVEMPETISEDNLQELVAQVPRDKQLSRFIVLLQQLEDKLEVNVNNLSFGSANKINTVTVRTNGNSMGDGKSNGSESGTNNGIGMNDGIGNGNGTGSGNLILDNDGMNGSSSVNGIDSLLANQQSRQELHIYEQDISMNLGGNYDQLTQFMNQLQEMSRIVNVRTWQLTPLSPAIQTEASSTEDIQQEYQLQLTCTMYYVEGLAQSES